MKAANFELLWLVLLLSGAMVQPPAAGAEEAGRRQEWAEQVALDWGGHLKVRGRTSWPGADSFLGSHTLYDASFDARLTNQLRLNERTSLETHYEFIFSGGDTRQRESELISLLPGGLPAGFLAGRLPEDDRRLFDLTHLLHEGEETIAYHRLDRLVLTHAPEWGTLRLGRQAVTLGNGLLFNPMDLFNPFAPTDVERDYKLGDDLASFERPLSTSSDLQLLYVPRRNPQTGNLAWDESSLAGRLHWAPGVTELDLLLAKHFDDAVFGLGSVGYLGGAACRLDATWTLLDGESRRDDFFSLVANLDYAWMWWEKNCYGFVEFFYNGLGRKEGDYPSAFADQELLDRLERGELFTLGRTYLAGHVQVELHPLVNFFLTVIGNVQDPSGIVQPRLSWDLAQDLQLLAGGAILFGGNGTELGGFPLPGSSFTTRAADSAYLWLSYYF